jgi:hypothetical protein
MSEVQMAIQVAQDRKAVAIEIAPPEHSPLQLILDLDELNGLISKLGNARSQMVAGQPQPDFENEGVTISTVANTKWYIRASPPSGVLFAFDHPKFGAVGLTLAADQIAQIVRFLTDRFILQATQSAEKH